MDFLDLIRDKMKLMEMDQALLNRPVNAGFSGGEKKRNEIFQMAVLEPRLAILDETDSGLDIDALKLVAHGVNALRSPERSMIVVTHYQRLLNYIVPDFVHVLAEGPHREIGRQGTGAGAGRERLRRAGHRGRRGGGRQGMTAVAEQTGAWLESFTGQQPRGAVDAGSCAKPPSSASRSWASPPRTTRIGDSPAWRRSRARRFRAACRGSTAPRLARWRFRRLGCRG